MSRPQFPTSLRRVAVAMAIAGTLSLPALARADSLPWMNASLPAAQRAQLLVGAMTLDQKIQQISMNTGPNPDLPNCGTRGDSRHISGIPELSIPTIRMTNGPIGVGGGDCNPDRAATGVPTALAVAATFDTAAATAWGDIVGDETRRNGLHVFLAPGINLGRVPNNGRNFEYFGEDPYLTGSISVAEVKAIQAHGIQATTKHYVANEQETQRQRMNVVVDDRTLHELYLLPFEMSVKDANLSALMCSYPHVNGVFSCESTALLTDVLRGQWGFSGYMMSDRGATHSTAPSIKAGLDLEFGSNAVWFAPVRIKAALAAGDITTADLDTMLERRYGVMFRLGQFDDPIVGVQDIDFATHGETARTIAEQGAVLLKNENALLPLQAAQVHSIAVIGPQTFAGAAKFPATGPGGFITVNAPYSVTPVQGLTNALAQVGGNATVTFNDGTDLTAAANLAAGADIAIVMVGDISLEGQDRPNLSLPVRDGVDQEALIAAVAARNPRTVVVLKNGGPVIMPWLGKVPAVLEAWYPGQEDGNAVATLLFGIANPSGKLPISFPAAEGQTAANTAVQFPGLPDSQFPLTAIYTEKLEMGYRWYDAQGVKPLYPFGYGLSYTSFAISKLEVTPKTSDGTHPILVQFFVENTGKVAGAEVPQVYVGLPSAAGEPPKRLVAFEKVWLAPGQKKRVQIVVDPAATSHPLGIFDSASQQWKTVDGSYAFYVGSSSADLAASNAVTVRTPGKR